MTGPSEVPRFRRVHHAELASTFRTPSLGWIGTERSPPCRSPCDRTPPRRSPPLLRERILVLDGAMGTPDPADRPDEAGYRGERFADWRRDVKGNNDLLNDHPAGHHRPASTASTSRPAPTSSRPTPSTPTSIAQADYGMRGPGLRDQPRPARLARAAADEVVDARPTRATSPARSARPRAPRRSAGRQRPRPPATSPTTSSSRRTSSRPAASSTAAPTCSSSRRSSTPSTPRRRSSRSRRCSRSTAAAGRWSCPAPSPTPPAGPSPAR